MPLDYGLILYLFAKTFRKVMHVTVLPFESNNQGMRSWVQHRLFSTFCEELCDICSQILAFAVSFFFLILFFSHSFVESIMMKSKCQDQKLMF